MATVYPKRRIFFPEDSLEFQLASLEGAAARLREAIMAKRKPPKTTKKRVHHKIKKVKLPKDVVLRVEAHPEALPMVVSSAPGVVDIVSVTKETAAEPMGWMEYLFGK